MVTHAKPRRNFCAFTLCANNAPNLAQGKLAIIIPTNAGKNTKPILPCGMLTTSTVAVEYARVAASAMGKPQAAAVPTA